MNNTAQEKEDFYNNRRNVISNVQHRNKFILIGDFNARMGNDYQVSDCVLGYYGVRDMNPNGLCLLFICREFNHQYLLSATKLPQDIVYASPIEKMVP